jgi:carbamoyl-phosphate synthase large subunit
MRRRCNILVSSAGRRVALQRILRASLEELGLDGEILAADCRKASAAFHCADRAFVVPRCDDPAFVPAMVELCRRERVDLLVPTIDPELPVYAAARRDFAAVGTTVAVSAPEVIRIASDKALTNSWLRDHGFPATAQLDPDAIRNGPADDEFPLIVKPRRGSSSVGLVVATDRRTLDVTWTPDQVVERIAPGTEYTVDVLVGPDGFAQCATPRRRVEVRGGEVSKAVVERRPDVMDLALKVTSELPGAFGVLNVQLFVEDTGPERAIVEINSRFGGGFPLTHEAGGRYSTWLIEDLLGLPSSQPAAEWRDGLAMLRFDDAVFVPADEADLA